MDARTARGLSKLAKYRRGKHATKAGQIPADPARGSEAVPFVWRSVSGQEQAEARAAAVAFVDEMGLPDNDIDAECAWQILHRAMRDPDVVNSTLAASVDELREMLTVDERDRLWDEWEDFKDEVNPNPFEMPAEVLELLDEVVKKKGPSLQAQLMSFGSRNLARFIIISDDRRASSDSGSSGSSAESAEKS